MEQTGSSTPTVILLDKTGSSSIDGIAAGFTGDLQFFANQFGGIADAGEFEITGTLFSVDTPPPFVLGDTNQDGIVSFSDIPAFIDLLIGGDFLDEADTNRDGVVNFSDIPPFIELLISLAVG